MTKKEFRKIFRDSFAFATIITAIQSFVFLAVLGIGYFLFDSIVKESFLLGPSILVLFILWLIVSLIGNYITLCKEKKEDTKNMEYINSVFKTKQVWVKPKKLKAYENLFEQLESTHTLRYFAISIDEKILIFINIDNEDIIKIEEVDKTDFLEFYEII